MDSLNIFVAVTTAAVVIQAGILVFLYLAVRQTSARMEAAVTEVKAKLLPTAELAHSILSDLTPKIETIAGNVSDTSAVVLAQIQRLDATLNDVIDRARLQVIRADELVGRTLDRVEQTTEIVHKTVVSPVRQVSGLVQGLTTGLEFFFSGRRRAREGAGVAQDEMFI
jgi:predicted  nucleic acid-binding Zn-ribbon protein